MYQFCPLRDICMEQLSECFNMAFSDYEQPICFTPESMKYYLTASNVDLSVSFGAFCQGQMVGFILNSRGVYHDQAVVFDAGTGIAAEHRGKKVFSALFDYTAVQLQKLGIEKYYLEVLQSNRRAVSIYSKKGFSVLRSYSVLMPSDPASDGDVPVAVAAYGDFEPFATRISVEPSFEHTTYTVRQNPQLYEVGYLAGQAYCIYAKRNGEIIQMHYNNLDSLKTVMSALVQRYPRAMAKNVDYQYPQVIEMLTEIGFREITNQYEMVRDI